MTRKKIECALSDEDRDRAKPHISGWDDMAEARRDELTRQWLRKDRRPSHGRIGMNLTDGVAQIGTPSDGDKASYAITLYDTFATKSDEFLEARLLEMTNLLVAHKLATESGMNGLLAFVGGCSPENEQQSAMATQMAMTQLAANRALSLAGSSDTLEKFNAYTNAATKLARTFVAQTEAYSKLQRGGVQVVKHVNVYEGGQAVVADTVNTGGMNGKFAEQAQATGDFGTGAALLGHDPQGHGVPIPGGAGQEAVPDARRGGR